MTPSPLRTDRRVPIVHNAEGHAQVLGPDLLRHLDALTSAASRAYRTIIAIAGTPGSGKSSLAGAVVERCLALGLSAVWLPMDGFHLADTELARLGLSDRKGAQETFDAAGYVATLARVRESGEIVYAPTFDRGLEQPIAGSIRIDPSTRVVVTEGNYLLCRQSPWDRVHELVDETWQCEIDEDLRYRRLVARHMRYGKDHAAARQWVDVVDVPNAQEILRTSASAARTIAPDHSGAWELLRS